MTTTMFFIGIYHNGISTIYCDVYCEAESYEAALKTQQLQKENNDLFIPDEIKYLDENQVEQIRNWDNSDIFNQVEIIK